MRKKTLLVLSVILILCLLFMYKSYKGAISYSLNPQSDKRITVNVEKGESASDIADTLSSKGLIKSGLMFKVYLKLNGLSDKLKAGRIVLQENYDLTKITESIISGKSAEQSVTILEGWTAQQISDYLESEGLTTADKFMACVKTCKPDFSFLPKGILEGYLYPDTYFVNPASYSDEAFVSRMVGTLNNKLTSDDWNAIKNSKHTFQEIVTMASIVEREERNSDEQPTVAGILWNRFDSGTGLGADATILYALGRTKGGLTYNDLQTDSPYNTRKYRGLPPTPISNPGIISIKAAIYPTETDYFYYLHDSDGQVHYAKTLDEHNANKRKYL